MQEALTNKQVKIIIWFNRILRWALGGLFVTIGIIHQSYIAIGFGAAMIVTGFFKPKRCIGGNCEVKKERPN